MNCPDCDNQMDQGIITAQSLDWMPEILQQYVAPLGIGTKEIEAYRCRSCGRVEVDQSVN